MKEFGFVRKMPVLELKLTKMDVINEKFLMGALCASF